MEALESRESFKQDKKMPGSVVERGSLKDKDGQMTPVDEIRRSQSQAMDIEHVASSLGDKNPFLERRGTIGYAFAEEGRSDSEVSSKAVPKEL